MRTTLSNMFLMFYFFIFSNEQTINRGEVKMKKVIVTTFLTLLSLVALANSDCQIESVKSADKNLSNAMTFLFMLNTYIHDRSSWNYSVDSRMTLISQGLTSANVDIISSNCFSNNHVTEISGEFGRVQTKAMELHGYLRDSRNFDGSGSEKIESLFYGALKLLTKIKNMQIEDIKTVKKENL